CSHQHTPNSMESGGPGLVESKNGIYIAWNVFQDYSTKGSLILKETVLYALNRILTDKSMTTNLPVQGIMTATSQERHKIYVNHFLYAPMIKRGKDLEVIEDMPTIYDVKAEFRMMEKAKRIYLAPEMKALSFQQNEDVVKYIVP